MRAIFLYLLAIHRRWRGEPTPIPFQLQSGIVTSLILPRPQEPSSTKNFSPGGCGGGGSCLSTCCALPMPHAAKNKTNEHKRDFICIPPPVDNNLLLCLPSASSLLCLKSMCTMHDQHERQHHYRANYPICKVRVLRRWLIRFSPV